MNDCLKQNLGYTTTGLIFPKEGIMAKVFKYVDERTNKTLFETTEPNYMQIEDVDKKVIQKTGYDPRLNPWINREIRTVNDNEQRNKKVRRK